MPLSLALLKDIESTAAEVQAANHKQAANFRALKALVSDAIAYWNNHFPGETPPLYDGKTGITVNDGRGTPDIPSWDTLCNQYVEGEELKVEMESCSRGMCHYYDVDMPLRYLGTEGQLAMDTDAASIKAAREEAAIAEQAKAGAALKA